MAFRRRPPVCGGKIITPEQGTKLKQFIYDATKECIDNNPILYDNNNLQSIVTMNICWNEPQGRQVCHSAQIKGVNFIDIYRQQQKCNTETNPQIKKRACDNLNAMIKDYQTRLTSTYRWLKTKVPQDASNIILTVTTNCSRKAYGRVGPISPPTTSPPQSFQNPIPFPFSLPDRLIYYPNFPVV